MILPTVFYSEEDDYDRAKGIADRLAFSIERKKPVENESLFLFYQNRVLRLFHGSVSIHVDLVEHLHKMKVTRGLNKKSLLAKAVGLAAGASPLVVDATAGLGRDAVTLAALGCNVVGCEKNPVLFEMLQNGLERTSLNENLSQLCHRITCRHVDSVDFLSNDKNQQPDVVYLDPMYPEKKKSALPKKEMQILQMLLGADSSGEKLLASALTSAKKRVVVKRPLSAPPLAGSPSLSIQGKTVRYDVYLTSKVDT